VLTLTGLITQASSTSVIYFFCSSLSLALFVVVYHLLNRQISERQLVEANFQDLYNNAPCGYHTIEQDGTFIAINNTELSWLGYSRDEVIGKLKLSDLLLPESLATFQENFESIRSGGRVKDLEFQMIRKDGTILPVLLNSTAIKDEAGNVVATRSTLFDITKRKQAEEKLRLTQDFLTKILEYTPARIYITTAGEDRYRLVNRAWEEFIGMRREEVIGRSLDELLPPAMAKHFKKVNQQVMDTGAPVITEEFVEVADGRHYFYTVKFPMHDALGQIEAVGGISIDMTERKQAEEALRKSEERFRLAVDNVPDVFVIYDAQRRLQFVNAEGLRRSGLSEEALLGHTDEELFPPEVTQGYLPTLQRAVETRTSQTTECSITLPTIGTSTIVVTYVPLLDDRGEIYSILGITHDLTERKQAEVQLQHSEEKFRQLAENIHEVFWMTNANVREILYVSPAYEQIWGRSCESLYVNPKSFRDAIHPDDQQRVSAHLEPNVNGTFDIEYRIVRPDGSVRWIRDRGFPIRNESGEIYRRAGIAQDITQRKQAEAILRQVNEELEIRVAERTAELSQANERLQHELFERERVEQALRQSEEHFRSAFDYAAIGMALVALDGRWLKVNHSLCEIVGYSEQELLATAFQAITHPDDLDTDLGYAGQLLAGEIRSYQMEKRYFHKLGHVVWIFLSGSLVRDAQSQPLYFIAQIQDITARKQAEEARRESEERLQAILDNATAIIYLKDTEGRFILINRQLETLFQKPKEDILGKNNYDFFPKEMADTFHANDRRVIEAGTPLEFEEIVPHDDGIHTYISIKFPLKDPEGIPYAVCGISTDISDRKRAEDARRASEEQLQAILDNSPAVIYLIDAHNRHLLINRGYENLVSMTNEEIVGKSIYDVWPHDLADVFAANNQKVLESGTAIKIEEVAPHEDGLHTYITSKFPLQDANGVPYAVCGISTDITERKQAEEILRKQACIFENLYDGVILTDLEGRIIDWNPAAERIFGYAKAEVLGKTPGILHKPEESSVLTHKIIQGMLGAGRWAGEINFIRKDGTEGVCETVVVPLHNEQGQAIATIGVNSDISDRKLAMSALRESEERFRSMADSVPVLLWVAGTDALYTFFNRTWLQFTGRTLEQELGVGWMEGLHPDELQRCLNTYQSAFNARQSFEMEYHLRRADGEYRWILDTGIPRFTPDGTFAGYIGSCIDITERKQVEEERAKLIAILEATPDLVASASLDEQIYYLNSAARKVFGFGENEDFANFTIPDVHPEWAYEIVRNEGIPAARRDGVWVGETAVLSNDGRDIPVSQVIIAHKSADGSIKMLSTIARDITQQKQIAATLLEAERRWRSLLENVRLVVVGLDNHGKVEYVNPCFLELVGYTKAEVIGKDWFETFLPLHQRHREQNNFIALLEEEFHNYDHNTILTKSGEERVIAWNNTLLQNLQGEVIGTLSIGEDITERQVIERMKDEFISVVSHELRTPLTSIHGALNLIASGLVDTQSQKGRRVIEIAAESAERLVRLVNDILELERLESGKISLLKQTCNAADLMIQATDMIQVMANRAGISLSVSPQAIELHADPDRIIQVLTNLLGNAIKFSSSGSTVWLTVELQESEESGRVGEWESLASAEEENSLFVLTQTDQSFTSSPPHPLTPTVLFNVKDQGRGIPADKLESIFERFHQVDASDSRKKGGTGLGLAICRSIVQQHGGQLWVESTLGEGSSFYFTLPMRTVKDDNHDNQADLGD